MRIASGLLLAFFFVSAGLTASLVASTMIKEYADADGDVRGFEARIRHYTDGFAFQSDGFRLVKSRNPIFKCGAILSASIAMLIGSGIALLRLLRPRARSILFVICAEVVLALPFSFVMQKPYRRERLLVMLYPESDPRGSGFSAMPMHRPLLPPWRVTAMAATAIVIVGSLGYVIATRRRTIP